MDDLAALLEGTFKVSNDMYATSGVHPRFSQYKSRTAGASDQEVRRKRILEQQKQSRYDYQNHVRQLAEGRFNEMDSDKPQSRNFYRGGKGYRDQLMLSEWMVEVPEDFEQNWVMVPCPVGKRALVIASYGQTSSWSKGGWLINKFESLLPGGSKRTPRWNTNATVLDCIYCEMTKTYYVLDMMCWKEQPQYECETEFRFYWLSTKISEMPELMEFSKLNKFRFDPLPNYSCNADNIGNVLQTKMNVQLDGLLFFHKHTHYTLGSTPLVTWLKPYMVPDILGIQVGQEHMKYKPVTYTTFAAHLEKVKEDQQKADEKDKARKDRRQERRRSANTSMDTTPSQTPEKPKTRAQEKTCSEPAAAANNEQTNDVTESPTIDDVVIEEEELIGDDIDSETPTSPLAGDNTSQGASGVSTVTALKASGDASNSQQLDIGQWNPTGNENPFNVESSRQADSTMEDSASDEQSPVSEPVRGIIKLPKNSKVAQNTAKQSGAAAQTEDSEEKKEKAKPKKLRGGKKVKGRNS